MSEEDELVSIGFAAYRFEDRTPFDPLERDEVLAAMARTRFVTAEAAGLLKVSPTRLRTFIKNDTTLSQLEGELNAHMFELARRNDLEMLTGDNIEFKEKATARHLKSNPVAKGLGFGVDGRRLNIAASGQVIVSWDESGDESEPARPTGPPMLELVADNSEPEEDDSA